MKLHDEILDVATRLKFAAREKADQPDQLAAVMVDMGDRLTDAATRDMPKWGTLRRIMSALEKGEL